MALASFPLPFKNLLLLCCFSIYWPYIDYYLIILFHCSLFSYIGNIHSNPNRTLTKATLETEGAAACLPHSFGAWNYRWHRTNNNCENKQVIPSCPRDRVSFVESAYSFYSTPLLRTEDITRNSPSVKHILRYLRTFCKVPLLKAFHNVPVVLPWGPNLQSNRHLGDTLIHSICHFLYKPVHLSYFFL